MILSGNTAPQIASIQPQPHMDILQDWVHKQKIKVNETKVLLITFTLKHAKYSSIQLNNVEMPRAKEAIYSGFHFDDRLT